jgi:hypothetical protein
MVTMLTIGSISKVILKGKINLNKQKMKNLIKSLSAFQNECPIIHKDTKGHNYTYADLPQIFNTINPLMKKHGLCFSQLLENDGIRTILFHVESAEQLESFTLIPKVKLGSMNDYQAYGSGVTYFRRYAISAILGLVTDKDTDAAGTQVPSPNNSSLTTKDLKELDSVLIECQSVEAVKEIWDNIEEVFKADKRVIKLVTDRKNQLTK